MPNDVHQQTGNHAGVCARGDECVCSYRDGLPHCADRPISARKLLFVPQYARWVMEHVTLELARMSADKEAGI